MILPTISLIQNQNLSLENAIELFMLSFMMYGDEITIGDIRLKETVSYNAFGIQNNGLDDISNADVLLMIKEYYNYLLVINYFFPKQ